MKTRFVATIPLALAFALPAAAGPAAKSPTSSSSLSASDRAFMAEAARGGLAEVELGRLAEERASRPDVKAFGEHMVADHSKANADLRALAESKGATVPSAMDAKDAKLKKRLAHLSGDAFDRAYVEAMLKDHRHDVAAFEKESTAAHDPDVEAFASRTLPTLKEHLTRVEELSKKVSAATASASRRM